MSKITEHFKRHRNTYVLIGSGIAGMVLVYAASKSSRRFNTLYNETSWVLTRSISVVDG